MLWTLVPYFKDRIKYLYLVLRRTRVLGDKSM
jgi:hypothetical protein